MCALAESSTKKYHAPTGEMLYPKAIQTQVCYASLFAISPHINHEQSALPHSSSYNLRVSLVLSTYFFNNGFLNIYCLSAL